jgi:hypothetical protein
MSGSSAERRVAVAPDGAGEEQAVVPDELLLDEAAERFVFRNWSSRSSTCVRRR